MQAWWVCAWLLSGCDAVHRIETDSGGQRRVEAVVFEGGYGTEWHRRVAARFNESHARDGLVVDLWGEPRLVEKVKPRLLRGDPPDLILENKLPVWLLIAAGKLLPFDEALDRVRPGESQTWREQFIPGTLDTFRSEGRVWSIPSALTGWTFWYDARLFRERGWSPPETWTEFTALCERIKEAGLAPVAFQGKYSTYAWTCYIALTQRIGGVEAINRMNRMEEGAFSQETAVEAARLLQDMAVRHFQRGAMAMTHTESQLQFINGHAAFVWCGFWLENEQKGDFPPGFELRCLNVPAVEGGRGNPESLFGFGGESIFVPADARHPEAAIAFTRYLVSLEQAPDMAASIGVISPLRGGTPREAVTPAMRSALDLVERAPGIFSERLSTLLVEWANQVMAPMLAALLRGEVSPEEFGEAMDAGVRAARANPDLLIPECIPYDPRQFGESP